MHNKYLLERLPLETRIEVIKDAAIVAYESKVDMLDCNVSWSRQKVDMSVEDAIALVRDNTYFTCFLRREDYSSDLPYFEFGFNTMNGGQPDYFLWLYLELADGYSIISKYNIQEFKY